MNEDLLELMRCVNPNAKITEIKRLQSQYYAHYNAETLNILAINKDQTFPKCESVKVDYNFANNIISGKESLLDWKIKNRLPVKIRFENKNSDLNRIDFLPFVKIKQINKKDFTKYKNAAIARKAKILQNLSDPHTTEQVIFRDMQSNNISKNCGMDGFDIVLYVNDSIGQIKIKYNPHVIKIYENKLRFFFTKEDDPSFLKCNLALSEQLLNAMSNNIEWPNPLIINVPLGTDDMSIYTIKSNLEIIGVKE